MWVLLSHTVFIVIKITTMNNDKKPLSVVHSLGNFGQLHAGTLPSSSFEKLRKACAKTSCCACHSNVEVNISIEFKIFLF